MAFHVTFVVAGVLFLVTGCAGSLDHPERFSDGSGTGAGGGTVETTAATRLLGLCGSYPQVQVWNFRMSWRHRFLRWPRFGISRFDRSVGGQSFPGGRWVELRRCKSDRPDRRKQESTFDQNSAIAELRVHHAARRRSPVRRRSNLLAYLGYRSSSCPIRTDGAWKELRSKNERLPGRWSPGRRVSRRGAAPGHR